MFLAICLRSFVFNRSALLVYICKWNFEVSRTNTNNCRLIGTYTIFWHHCKAFHACFKMFVALARSFQSYTKQNCISNGKPQTNDITAAKCRTDHQNPCHMNLNYVVIPLTAAWVSSLSAHFSIDNTLKLMISTILRADLKSLQSCMLIYGVKQTFQNSLVETVFSISSSRCCGFLWFFCFFGLRSFAW